MNADPAVVSTDAISIAVRSIHATADGSRTDFDALFHLEAIDHENTVQPPSSRVAGPAGFYSTACERPSPICTTTSTTPSPTGTW
jgi:hypothetical protein